MVYGVKIVGYLFHLDIIAGENACSGANDARPIDMLAIALEHKQGGLATNRWYYQSSS